MEDPQMRTRIVLAAVAVLVATPALAQEFYVVQDTATKKCTIVQQKPTTTTTVVVGGDKVFKTRTEAEAAVKTITVCQ
jgi:vancomycin permeability regulator SanA